MSCYITVAFWIADDALSGSALDGEWRDQREIEARCGVPPPRDGRPFVWTEEDFRNLGMSIDVGRALYGLLDGGRAERRQEVGGPAEWRSCE